MTLIFLSPLMLLLLPLALLPFKQRASLALPISSLIPYAKLPTGWREALSRYHQPLAALGIFFFIFSFSEPTVQKSTEVTIRQGVNLMLALDISASMAAEDIKPSRIEVARTAAADFVHQRRNDKVGVILFSGVPFLLAPPTEDPAPIIERLLQVKPDKIGSGTAIGDALAAAAARLPQQQTQQSAVILLTDGRSNRGRITPLAGARAAAALGIKVYTIGFGSREGAYINLTAGSPPQKVILDEAPLQQIAELSGGRYFRATGVAELAQVYRQIDLLEKAPLETRQQVDHEELQPLLLKVAAFLFGLELILFRIILRRVP